MGVEERVEETADWSELEALVGTDLGSSAPVTIDQQMVDVHAETTGDAQWIHNDPDRARAEGPFGGPIVQGFLLLALFTKLTGSLALPPMGPLSMTVNYGFDRVRFVAPVPVGATVRLAGRLASVRPRDTSSAVVGVDLTLEAVADGGTTTPSVAARWLFLAVR